MKKNWVSLETAHYEVFSKSDIINGLTENVQV